VIRDVNVVRNIEVETDVEVEKASVELVTVSVRGGKVGVFILVRMRVRPSIVSI
jgi:hypothetical protein